MQVDISCFKLFVAFAVLVLQFPSLSLGRTGNADANTTVRCREREREALLAFKQGSFVVDSNSRLVFSSWGRQVHKQECCKWEGVKCSNSTGHVIQLDLGGQYLQGKLISPKLIELEHLEYLDLSRVNFTGSQIPDFIPSLTNLRHLDLSDASFSGTFPTQVGNLSHLQYLDLGGNHFTNIVQSFNWLPPLSSLEYLRLSNTNFSRVLDWSEAVNKLPNLQELSLYDCGLPSPLRSPTLSSINSSKSLSHVNLAGNNLTSFIFPWLFNYNTTLVHLDLIFNHIGGLIPDGFGYMSSLSFLDLSYNNLEGAGPNSFSRLCMLRSSSLSNNIFNGQLSKFVTIMSTCAQNSLVKLDLGSNDLEGSLPNFTNFTSLKQLDLRNNQLRGRLPESVGHMPKLEWIVLSNNALEGVISEAHFSRLSRLTYLGLSFNSLILNFSSDWIPPFQLEFIKLASCKHVDPHFPKWLQTQKNYFSLDISNSGISDVLPSWIWDRSPNLALLNLSHNQIRGTFEHARMDYSDLPLELDLSWNQLEGRLPSILLQAKHLDVSNNKIAGSISSLCASAIISSNLTFLSLSSNNVSGEFPDCLTQLEMLVMLDLSNNSLSGKIPSTIGSLSRIETLKLRGNKFVGELPSSLKNCTSLKAIDVGDNELSGQVPQWLMVSFPGLVVLMLPSNHFSGSMPSELCHLSRIQILDFSMNNISGSIPKCLNNLTALAQKGNSNLTVSHSYEGRYVDGYQDDAALIWKGVMRVYKNTLGLVKSMDLSSNRLTGEIPSEITHLVGLVSLNLSRNHLTGQISPNIGKLDSLDSLDLSRNQINGRIPASLSQISRLGFLDLSHNNLSGKIPTGTQLQSFDPSVYAGNVQLCGPPLAKLCDSEQTVVTNEEDADDNLLTRGFYVSLAVGFVFGFWGFCGSLIFNRAWRYAYFKLLNVSYDWIYVRAALMKQKFKDKHNASSETA